MNYVYINIIEMLFFILKLRMNSYSLIGIDDKTVAICYRSSILEELYVLLNYLIE